MFKHDESDQEVFDAFNQFIFSSDRKILAKLVSKVFFLNLVSHLPGDIVELGVFKGSGIFAWAKINEIIGKKNRRIFGFDFFDQQALLKDLSGVDKDMMRSLFEDRGFSGALAADLEQSLSERCQNIGLSNVGLVKGDVSLTVPEFLNERPGFRACLVNFDLDIYQPTLDVLNAIYDKVVPGGVLVFDEYGIDEWTESNAVDEFFQNKNIQILGTDFKAPSAFVQKPI